MKEYRILAISENKMGISNQKIAIFVMAEIKYLDFTLPSHKKTYTFDSFGDEFIFDLNSLLSKSLINKAINEEIVTLELSEFKKRKEIDNGEIIIRYFHKNVNI